MNNEFGGNQRKRVAAAAKGCIEGLVRDEMAVMLVATVTDFQSRLQKTVKLPTSRMRLSVLVAQ